MFALLRTDVNRPISRFHGVVLPWQRFLILTGRFIMTRRNFVATSVALSAAGRLKADRVIGANDRIGIGVIGCGDRGRRALLREALSFADQANIEVRAVCDIWRQQREKAAAQVTEAAGNDPKQIEMYEDLLASPDIDAVLIASPDHQHCTHLIAAVEAGKDVYVEKPLAMDMKELNRAVDAVKKSDRVVQMGTQVRSFGSSKGARDFVQAGGLGDIFKLEQSRNGYRPYWHRTGERTIAESDTNWREFVMHRKQRPWNADQHVAWYGYREFSRGPHTNLMVHFVDLVHYITGASAPARVMTMGGTYRWKDARTAPDSVESVLEYPDKGFLVRYCTMFGIADNSYLKFFGTRGTMDASRWSNPFLISGERSQEEDRILPGAFIPETENTPHMLNFLECIRSRKKTNAPIEAGYAHSVAVIMADESMIRGQRMVHDAKKRRIHPG